VVTAMNQIQRRTVIRAPRARVWNALTNIAEFCRWFSCESAAPAFQPGVRADMISVYGGQRHKFFMEIVEMLPEHTFSWRWHPGSVAPGEDLSAEPMTFVTFTLEEAEGGTHVTVTETGFEHLFASRRSRVMGENTEGWKIQFAAFERYFGETA
jgi:uncharacterized protein YndB with AHSA1/START domain